MYPFEPNYIKGNSPFDPREAMFMTRQDTHATLFASKVIRAEMCGDPGTRTARIEFKAPSENIVVLECPESTGFLVTRAYVITDGPNATDEYKGVVQAGYAVEYQEHAVDGKTVRFPWRIRSNFAGSKQPRTTEGYMDLAGPRQVLVTLHNLKLNAPLADDAFRCPEIPADVRFSFHHDRDAVPDLSQVPEELRARAEEYELKLRKSLENTKRMTAPLAAMVGKPAPELPAEKWIGGARPSLAGKPYLLAFWATWCGPCKNDLPTLRQMAAAGTQIVGMHPFGVPAEEVEQFVRNRKLGYPTLLAGEDIRREGIPQIGGYAAPMFPYYVLVDAAGQVAAYGDLYGLAPKLRELSK